MSYQNHYLDIEANNTDMHRMTKARQGIIRIALLFGSAALALLLIIIPIMVQQSGREIAQPLFPNNIDMISTGSVQKH